MFALPDLYIVFISIIQRTPCHTTPCHATTHALTLSVLRCVSKVFYRFCVRKFLNISDSGRRNRRTSCLYFALGALFIFNRTTPHFTSSHLFTSIHDATIRITPLPPTVPTLCPATDTDSYSDPRASASSSFAATCTLFDDLLPTGGPYL